MQLPQFLQAFLLHTTEKLRIMFSKIFFFALRNLVPFVQFKKLEEHPLGSVVFSNLQLY